MYAKLSKCEFWLDKVSFEVHATTMEGTAVGPSKMEAVANRQAPRNADEVRSLLGLAGYFRIFVKDFSRIAKP